MRMFVLLLVVMVTGCGTAARSSYDVEIVNESGGDVTGVELSYDDGSWRFSFGASADKVSAVFAENTYPLPPTATIAWVDKDGERHSRRITIRDVAPKNFATDGITLIIFLRPNQEVLVGFRIRRGQDEQITIPGESAKKTESRDLVNKLIDACRAGDQRGIETLLDHGADINAHVVGGTLTPLAAAVDVGNSDTVQLLLNRGANPKHELIVAVYGENIPLVEMLVKHGADPNHAEASNYSPLIAAVDRRNVEMTQCLIRLGADVNKPIYNNITALYVAAQRGNKEIVSLLIEHGAKVNVTMANDGPSVLDAARGRNDLQIIELLQKAGAKE